MVYFLYLLFLVFFISLLFNGHFLIGFILIAISSFLLIFYSAYEETNKEIEKKNKETERINNMTAEQRARYDEQKQQERLDNTIDYTVIVGEESKKSLGSAVARGAVGGALLGPVGLVGGAISGKNKSTTTFTIVYKSGRREVKTVNNDSSEFERYARYIR